MADIKFRAKVSARGLYSFLVLFFLFHFAIGMAFYLTRVLRFSLVLLTDCALALITHSLAQLHAPVQYARASKNAKFCSQARMFLTSGLWHAFLSNRAFYILLNRFFLKKLDVLNLRLVCS